jgi:hypothetical protein
MIAWHIFTFLAGVASILSWLLYSSDIFGLAPVVIAVLLCGVGALGALRSSVLRSPVFCTSTHLQLKIEDRDGKHAVLSKTQHFRPLWNHITRIDEVITFDGTVGDFSALLTGVKSSTSQRESRPGSTRYSHEFDRSLRPLRKYTRKVSYRFTDSYTSDREFYEIEVLYPGIGMSVEILFPASRPPTNVCVRETSGAITALVKDLTLEDSDTIGYRAIRFKIFRVAVGRNFIVDWCW